MSDTKSESPKPPKDPQQGSFLRYPQPGQLDKEQLRLLLVAVYKDVAPPAMSFAVWLRQRMVHVERERYANTAVWVHLDEMQDAVWAVED